MLSSITWLHGKQDKPVGDKHMNCGEGNRERTIRENLTNPGHTGFLQNFELFLSSRKCLFGERTLCSYAKELPEKAARDKAKEPSVHRIGCRNNLGIFASA